MKNKILLFGFFTFFINNIFADAWDNFTMEEADAVVSLLKEHPFILDYCDCCSHDGEYAAEVFLLKVESAKIVDCEWDEGSYSVIVEAKILAKIPYYSNGIDIENPIKHKGKTEQTIYMNYTWGFDKENKRAAPIFDMVPYSYNLEAGSCKAYTNFPNPFNTNGVIYDIEYKKWYWENIL